MFKQISRDMPVIVDHLGMVPAERGGRGDAGRRPFARSVL
jgi:hypothetical protein